MQMFFYLCLLCFFVATNVNGDSNMSHDCSCKEIWNCTVGIFRKRLCFNPHPSNACFVPEMSKCMKKEKNCTFQEPDNFLSEVFERCLQRVNYGLKNLKQAVNNITRKSSSYSTNMENGNGKASFYSNILLITVVFAVIFYLF